MTTLLYILVVLVVITIWFFWPSAKEEKWPYRKKDYLLTESEKKCFNILYPIVVNEMGHYLFTKVRLEDLLWLPRE